MGLLSEGEPMDWQEMKRWQQHVRQYGVEQFIRLYNKLKVKKNENVFYASLAIHGLIYRTTAGGD